MRSIILYIDKNAKIIARIFLIIVTTTILVFFFPREGLFPYEFQLGKPWMHEDLKSTFNFPIHKTLTELEFEKDSLLKTTTLYYSFENEIINNQITNFNKSFENVWNRYAEKRVNYQLSEKEVAFYAKADSAIKLKYSNYVVNILKLIYEKGVIEIPDNSESEVTIGSTIVVIKNNVGEETDIKDLFTSKTAYQYLLNEIDNVKINPYFDIIILNTGFFKELNLNEFLVTNLSYNEIATKNVQNDIIKNISLTKGLFGADKKIIGKGEIVNTVNIILIESLKYEYENRTGTSERYYYIIVSQVIIVGGLILLLMIFLVHFRRDIYHNNLKFNFIVLLIILFTGAASLAIRKELFSLYIIPFAIVPIIVRAFYDTRLAMYVHIITIMIVAFMAPNSFEFIFLNFIVGTISIITLTNLYKRSRLFTTALYVVIAYSLIYLGLFLIKGEPFSNFPKETFIYFSANGFLILLSYPLIYIFEKMFGFVSDIKLMELADTTHPILRKLNEKAPGTFQHSLQVANIAEEAAYLIGANPLLVRVGALYHDIGKIYRPMYFIENIHSEKNPHSELTGEESAKIIIEHVYKGIEMARRAKIPEQIIDFIRTHHGNQTVQFFYRTMLKSKSEIEIDKSKFTYPGPIPFSKEMALLMMADSVEAASRSLKEFTNESINDLVENIVYFQKINEQFNDSNITYKDMSIVKGVFKRKLLNMYHVRVEYPAVT